MMMSPEAAASTVPTAAPKSTLTSSGSPTAAAPPNASTPRKDDKRSVDSQSRSGERADLAGVRSSQGRSSPNVMLPRNPRDTAVPFSPKRRIKGLSGAASLGGSTGNVHGVSGSMAACVGSAQHRSQSDAVELDNNINNSSNYNNNAHATKHPPSGRPTTPSNNAMLHPHAAIPLVHSLSTPLSCSTPNSIHDTPGSTQTTSPTQVTLDSDEQFMFEQRLTRDELGVAIRKINHSGKAQLRYVKCVPLRPPSSSDYEPKDSLMTLPYYLDDRSYRGDVSVSSRSTSSSRFLERIRSGMFEKSAPAKTGKSALSTLDGQDAAENNLLLKEETNLRALTWGKKNTVTIPLAHFVAVRKGKTTERTLRNASPSGRLLSIVTRSGRGCLDIEAPTRLDRDKFASAFSVFLGVPLEEERSLELRSVGEGAIVAKKKLKTPSITRQIKKKQASAAQSEPGLPINATSSTPKVRNRSVTAPEENVSILPVLTPSSDKASDIDKELTFFNDTKQTVHDVKKNPAATPGTSSMGDTMSASARKRILSVDTKSESMLDPPKKDAQDANAVKKKASNDDDDASHVSSLTGAVDQEIVEELHQAIIELRAELDASRAEAARAVKVAEQAIQSAENCSSSDWNSTVTHKAAEAAALAQKKSAEAIARARMAEERLSAERKSTAFWRRQAQAAEEEAGSIKTRSAAAELQQSVMVEELASEKRRAARMFASLKEEFGRGEERQAKELQSARERRRELEVEVERLKEELGRKSEEMKRIHEEHERKEKEKSKSNRMLPSFTSRRKKQSSAASVGEISVIDLKNEVLDAKEQAIKEKAAFLATDVASIQKQFALLRHTAKEELSSLQIQSKEWSRQAGRAISASLAETSLLREKLAAESSMRLKLLNELQDIRGTVRVYCRPKPPTDKSILKIPTHDILVLNGDGSPLSFKFDRVFSPFASQFEVFSELEEPLISSLDGFNVTLLAFGQHGSGKTHSVLGNCTFDSSGLPSLASHGVQLQSLQQLFNIARHRTDRFKDAFSITILEVHNEKLFDLIAGTPSAEENGEIIICETRDRRDRRKNNDLESLWQKGKLEIRTNIDGNTVVQGLISIPIESFEDVCRIWHETLAKRAIRLKQNGLDFGKHEKNSNIITTINITSVNIATGVGTEGRLQFVDLAASDIAHGIKKMEDAVTPNVDNIHFCNKSIDALNDVVNSRCQFDRSVPYRNSTLTHLLRDSLEADAKVLLLCCVSSDPSNLSDTIGALRFGARMQKVSIGKATKHIVGSKE
eukprot:CCRYP_019528-RA/>CCRYP_019528-RA protein AED:0.21 eAED:0.21 QI:342/1/1/1/1/1/4/96/1271